MAELVSPVITPVVESLMVTIKKHLGYLVSSTKHVKQMDAKMKQLTEIAKNVIATRDKAVGNTEVIPMGLESWLEDVKKLNERSDNLKESTGCFNLKKRYKVGKQSCDILVEINDLKERKSEITFTHAQISLAEVGSTSTVPSISTPVPLGTQIEFESRNLISQSALQALQSNDELQKMIALCGPGGVGKTIMMEQLQKAVVDSKTFNSIVKVVIGETYDAISLQDAIANYIGSELKETTKDARADRLQKIFEAKSRQGEKILVIMDDLWNHFNLKDVGLWPLPHGFKILFTSRFDNECAKMGVRIDSIFKVDVLNDIEAKTLFSQIVGPSPSDAADDVELQRTGDYIVKKCRGLPIAIVTIAKILVGHTKAAWEEALLNLQQNDLQEFDDILHKVFKMSYNNLKKEDDKAIFLLSGLFPDDFDIPIEDLMRYAWGLKLFTKVDTLERARRRANICVENLISANLLTKSDHKGFVKMHDLVRDFVLRNYSKVKQASLTYHTGESYERILLNCKNTFEFPSNFDCSNLSLLILMNEGKLLEFPKDTSERMKKLEVISYERIRIPFPIEHFTNLRALCLRSCRLLNDISFLGSLSNLETLSLVDCNIRRLPSTIGKLKKLKLLDLTGCISLHIDDGVIQNLKSLEELYMRTYPYYTRSGTSHVRFTHADCVEMEKLSPRLLALELEFLENMPNVKNVSFKNLKRFNISIGCRLESGYSKNYSFKNKLNLAATCNELRECNISDLFEKTEELTLQLNDMYNLEDVSAHHTFSQLKVLHVSDCKDLIYLFTVAVASGLKLLERLIISKCPNLKEIVGGNNGVGVITFQKLNFLSLKDLPNMLRLCDILIELPKLVELKIYGLPHFTTIYSDDNINKASTMLPLLNREVTMPKLEKLDISVMKNLKQIWPCEEKNEVSMLRKIEVRECDSLINLFPRNPFPLLNHLEELEVNDCGSIEVLFNIDFECVSGMGEHISRLRRIEVSNLGKINELWRMGGVNNSDIVVNCFKDVENIEIEACENFTDLFTPTTTNFDLGALNTYERRITGRNPLVKSNKESGQVSGACWSLCQYPTHVYIVDCDALSSLVPWYPVRQMIRLQGLEVRRSKSLKVLFESESVTNNTNVDEGSAPAGTTLIVPPLTNLKNLEIYECDLLSHVFTFSTLETLNQLKELRVTRCKSLQVIVKEENVETSSLSKDVQVFLPSLEMLQLDDLPNLKGFFLGKNEFRWPLLNYVTISNCPQMMVFTSGHSKTPKLKYIDTNLGRHSLECDLNFRRMINQTKFLTCSSSDDPTISKGMIWSFHNLVELHKRGETNVGMTNIIPSNVLLQLEKLEKIELINCPGVEEIFESLEEGSGFNESQHTTPHVVNIPNLTVIDLWSLSNLKYLWKSNRSMVLEFPSLTKVDIFYCDKLEYVFTCSMVGSLLQLQDLQISGCNGIEVIVKDDKEEECDIAKVNLPRLKSLKLDRLPRLKGFCLGKDAAFSCPALDTLTIRRCSAITVFTKGDLSTPNLNCVVTALEMFTINHEDLNNFIQTNQEKFEDGEEEEDEDDDEDEEY